jgi:two-component system, chemotaxis family, sensor kinase CheA
VNEFLQQFVIESRELIEAASAGLLILEQAPADSERLDEVFRAFHTLKGGAGIVDFAAMERVMHAAEDVLSEARTGQHQLTPMRIGQCLACLDQASQWLDTLEKTGNLPEEAATQADEVISRLGIVLSDPDSAAPSRADQVPTAWLDDILRDHSGVHRRATTAIRFVPAADSFYQAEDPLERMTSLPGLLALACTPLNAWGPLDSFDPFTCNLILTALSAAPPSEVAAHLQGHSGRCEVVALASGEPSDIEQPLPSPVIDVIKGQQALLLAGTPRDFAGRLASAGLTAANALLSCGRLQQAQRIRQATETGLLEKSPQPLLRPLTQLLTVAPPVRSGSTEFLQGSEVTVRTLRVNTERVDELVRLVGELTVVSNAIRHVVKLAQAGDPSVPHILKDKQSALDHLISELQLSALGMRVRPLRTVLQRFPRIVREMSASLGKSVELTIEGADTEADKAIIEMLSEPLLHVVRNAIDHGVEGQKDRAAAGKPPVASLQIRARRQSDQVLIQVSDDGPGIDVERVREVARAREIVADERLRTLSEADIIDLIFAPGFSTATEVTQVSGRGVGMDAVRRAVERIGGRVSITSRPGQGTTVNLLLPFSVMMTHVMTVEAGGQMFGLPVEAVIETVRVPQPAIAQIGAAQAIALRGRTIPIIDLATILGVEQAERDETEATLVIAVGSGEWCGFRVDRVGERLDLIFKPLEGLLAGTPGIIGTALLGDGRVLLVLDIGEMLQ